MIFTLSATFFYLLTWPLYKRYATPLINWYYLTRAEYKQMHGKRKAWRMIVKKVDPWMRQSALKGAVTAIERQMRLAGRPWKIGGPELLLLLGLGALGLLALSSVVQYGKAQFFLMAFLILVIPIRRLVNKAKRRQMEARTATRFIKRRLSQQLKRGVPLEDALREVAKVPGEFGETMQRLLAQLGARPLREIMRELRREYEVRELNALCLAIELADAQSMKSLVDSLDRQIQEEFYRLDEMIDAQTESVKPKLLGVAALTLVFTLVLAGYFGYMAYHEQMSSGSIFTGL